MSLLPALIFALLGVVATPAQGTPLERDASVREVLTNRGGIHRSLPAPGTGAPRGIAVLDGALWLARGADLYRLDRATGDVRERFDLPMDACGLAADGRFLYAVARAWDTGAPIGVIDPLAGRVVREITPPADAGGDRAPAVGLAWHDGALYVLDERGAIHEVEPDSGVVARSWRPGIRPAPAGLTTDGERLVAASRLYLTAVDPDSEERVDLIRIFVPPGGLAFHGGAYYVVEGDAGAGSRLYELLLGGGGFVLTLRVLHARGKGEETRFEIGPKRLTREKLRGELERLRRRPDLRRRDANGTERLGGVLIMASRDATRGEVAEAADGLRAAGFRDIAFGGELPSK